MQQNYKMTKIENKQGFIEDIWTDKSKHTLFVKVKFAETNEVNIYVKTFPDKTFTDFKALDIDTSKLGEIIYIKNNKEKHES